MKNVRKQAKKMSTKKSINKRNSKRNLQVSIDKVAKIKDQIRILDYSIEDANHDIDLWIKELAQATSKLEKAKAYMASLVEKKHLLVTWLEQRKALDLHETYTSGESTEATFEDMNKQIEQIEEV